MPLDIDGRNILVKYPRLLRASSEVFNKTLGLNKIKFSRKKNNVVRGLNKSFISKTKINIVGCNNTITIDTMSYLKDTSIYIYGNNNEIMIGKNVRMLKGDLHIEDDNNLIQIGDSTAIYGYTHIAVTEGKKVVVGEDCMFSSDVTIRTGDSHSIIDEEGNRLNEADNVYIGNHVWLGNKTTILKGSIIQSNSIVGTGSIVTKAFQKENIIIVGNPAKIVRENTNWLKERI